jgi:opacity protein-like surface antigen
MKKLFLFASALVLSAGVFAQQAQVAQKKAEDVVKFKELSYDFGKIKQGTPVSHDFVFTNISNSPVIIESAIPSCGCTTPVKPEGAVQKGKDDKITAGFNAANAGPFNKSITIKVAGIDMPLQLKITGEVLTADAYTKYEATKNKVGR